MSELPDLTIAAQSICESTIQKSRFIAQAFPVSTEVEAREILERVRKQYWDANHTCSAWRIGKGGKLERTNDDGEPSGSAGIPIGNAIRHAGVSDLLVTVTRYFGGVKLGVGGLIRAYGGCAKEAIVQAGIVERVEYGLISAEVGYDQAGPFEHVLRNSTFPLSEVTYNAANVSFLVALPEPERAPFEAFVQAQTSGNAVVRKVGSRIVLVPLSEHPNASH